MSKPRGKFFQILCVSQKVRTLLKHCFNHEWTLRQISESHEEESKIGSVTFKELLSKRVYWQPFLIAMFGMFGQQFCGINVVFFYQQTIFEKARSSIDPSKSRKLLKYKLEKSTNLRQIFFEFFALHR